MHGLLFTSGMTCTIAKLWQIYNSLRDGETQLLTTDYVIDETVTRLRYDTNHSVAVAFLEFIGNAEIAGGLTVVTIDKEVFEKSNSTFSPV